LQDIHRIGALPSAALSRQSILLANL